MLPHLRKLIDPCPPGNPNTPEFLETLGDKEAAEAYRKAMGKDASPSTTEAEQAPELSLEEIARLQAIKDRERGHELVEQRKRQYIEWAQEFELGDENPETWIAETFTFNPDGTVETKGGLNLPDKSLTRLPPVLTRVNGELNLLGNRFDSTKGFPQEIHGYLNLSGNQLTSLKGFPQEIHEDIILAPNSLTSLEGLPQEIHGSLRLSRNQLTSLESLPKEIRGVLALDNNRHLVSLDGLQGKKIGRGLDLQDIPAQSIPEGIELVGEVWVKSYQTGLYRDIISKGYLVHVA